MSRARNLADLLDANGDVASGALDNVPPSNDASALTTGTLPIARIADGDITAAKLGSTLDLSGKTVTLPSGVGSYLETSPTFSYALRPKTPLQGAGGCRMIIARMDGENINNGGDYFDFVTNKHGYSIVLGTLFFKHSMGSNATSIVDFSISRYGVSTSVSLGGLGSGISFSAYQDPSDANTNTLRVTNNGIYNCAMSVSAIINADNGESQVEFPSANFQPVMVV